MDLTTLSAILSQQAQDATNNIATLQQTAYTVSNIVNQLDSIAEINPQIKALMGTASIQMTAINSQCVLIQQTIDAISRIVD